MLNCSTPSIPISSNNHLIQLSFTMARKYDDPFADSPNLMYIWPHVSKNELHRRINETAAAGFSITEPQRGSIKEISLESTIDGKQTTLATFPPMYKGGLFVIMRKWDYFHRIYTILQHLDVQDRPEKVEWKGDLMDSWGRTILFIEHVLEAAIQWCRSPDHDGSICNVLRLFLAQERINTNHSSMRTRKYNIAPDDETALRLCKRSTTRHHCATLIPCALTARHDWQKADRSDGTRLWLCAVSEPAAIADVRHMIEKDRPASMKVSQGIPLGHLSIVVLQPVSHSVRRLTTCKRPPLCGSSSQVGRKRMLCGWGRSRPRRTGWLRMKAASAPGVEAPEKR